ncbi:MAG: zf-HC2 domain-containing protein [Myxococcales bacterium]
MTGRSTSSSGRIDDGKPGRGAMNCQDFEPFLFAYVDGEFDGPEKADADAHLGTCEACRREVEEQRAFKRKMREVASGAASALAPATLRDRIEASLEKERAPTPITRYLKPSYLVPASLAAAATIATVVWLSGTSPEPANRLIQEAILHHQRDLPLDVQAQGEQSQPVRDWLRGRVDFAPSRIPELRNVALRGARLSQLNGHPAAYVVYGPRGAGNAAIPSAKRVSLLVYDDPDLRLPAGRRIADRDVMLANQRGYNVVVWKDKEIAYTVVSDLDEQQLVELLQPLPKQDDAPPAAAAGNQ